MTLGPGEFETLRDRREGWRAIRDRVWVELESRVRSLVLAGPQNDPSRCWVHDRFRGLLQDPSDAEDFISEFVASRIKRIDAGELLDGFDADLGTDLCGYIAAAKTVRQRAVSYRNRRRRRLEVSIDAAESQAATIPGGRWPQDVRVAVRDALRLPPPPPTGIEAVPRHAALQTYPWQRNWEEFSIYRSDLAARVARHGDLEPLEHLERRHADAAEAIAATAARLERKLVEHPNRTPANRRKIESQHAKNMAAAILWPLAAEAVQALLSLPSAAAARQQISRYRRNLLRLFPSFAPLEAMLDGDAGEPSDAPEEAMP